MENSFEMGKVEEEPVFKKEKQKGQMYYVLQILVPATLKKMLRSTDGDKQTKEVMQHFFSNRSVDKDVESWNYQPNPVS